MGVNSPGKTTRPSATEDNASSGTGSPQGIPFESPYAPPGPGESSSSGATRGPTTSAGGLRFPKGDAKGSAGELKLPQTVSRASLGQTGRGDKEPASKKARRGEEAGQESEEDEFMSVDEEEQGEEEEEEDEEEDEEEEEEEEECICV